MYALRPFSVDSAFQTCRTANTLFYRKQTLAFAALQVWAGQPAALAAPPAAAQNPQAAVVAELFAVNALSQTPAINAILSGAFCSKRLSLTPAVNAM